MRHLKMFGALMLMLLLCDADSTCTTDSNTLILDPPEVIGKYNESVPVNCSGTDPYHDGMYWKVGNTTYEMRDEIKFFLKSISLSNWDQTAQCGLRLEGDIECKDLKITIYKTPDTVSVSTRDDGQMVEGRDYSLICDVVNVAPVQNLTVKWYHGNETVYTEMFGGTSVTPVNVSSTWNITAQRDYNGELFRCEAELHLGPNGPELIPTVSSPDYTAVVFYAPELKMDTEDVQVHEGTDVSLTCEAEGNPPPTFIWTCQGLNVSERTNNLSISQISTSTTCNCTAVNHYGSTTKLIHVHVTQTVQSAILIAMAIPEESKQEDCSLKLTPAVAVVRYGDPVSINCSTSDTDVSGMGWETPVNGIGFTPTTSLTWTVPKLEMWDIKPLCFVTLKKKQCKLTPNITLYKTPDTVSVSTRDDGQMVEGRDYSFICDVVNVAPVQNLTVKWYRGNETVHIQMFGGTSVTPVSVSSTWNITAQRDYNGELFRCEAELHLGPNGPELIPTVSSPDYTAVVLYKPLMKACKIHYVYVEHEFSMDMLPCEADGNPPPTVQWYYKGEAINASKPLTRTQSGTYTAKVVNALGNSSTSVDITIESSPSFTCSNRYNVRKDDNLQSLCEPEALPKPDTTWFKDGEKVATSHRFGKYDSGTYLLSATNKHGAANHTLYLNVLYAPTMNESDSVFEMAPGGNVTFSCRADGNPDPVIYWNNVSAQNVMVASRGRQIDISVMGATSTNAGVYICVATNEVGSVTRSVTLKIRGKTSEISLLWLIAVMLFIVLVVIIILCYKRSKKHGQYSFISDKAKDDSDRPIPMNTMSNGVQAGTY
uniref:hemicentin-1-like n=1 Tax=Scatophagus argus TaxID=75038 RepID=UPI001ED84713|nr:hemicentin-1-like [Scatophagus argus]